ncbi:unnamed protein product [Orchesella dallaii]|uniref:Uncharacterized protein n=1 Tax=Orchesella dallaii TaxID=48710 RepID=A0ABP1RR00_9HEXA
MANITIRVYVVIYLLQELLIQKHFVNCTPIKEKANDPKLFTGSFERIISDSSPFLNHSTSLLEYVNKTKTISKTGPVVNLNEYLQPFESCLVHITFFNDFDFEKGLGLPVILRGLQPALSIYKWGRGIIFMKPKPNQFPLNATEKKFPQFTTCQLSTVIYSKSCVELDYQRFTMQSKPWTCEVIISVDPPPFFFHELPYSRSLARIKVLFPNVFSTKSFHGKQRGLIGQLPSFKPINILVPGKLIDKDIESWINSVSNIDGVVGYARRDVFLVMETLQIMSGNKLEHSFAKIVSASVVALNPRLYSGSKHEVHLKLYPLHVTKRKTSDFLQLLTRDSEKGEMYWNILFFYYHHFVKISDISVDEGFKRICHTLSENSRISSVITETNKFSLIDAQFKIWNDIFQNYTMMVDYIRLECDMQGNAKYQLAETSFGISQDTLVIFQNEDAVDNSYFPIYVANPSKSLTFVSCGAESMETFAFMELLNVFDPFIWIWILLLLLIFMPIFLNFCEYADWIINQNENAEAYFSLKTFLQPIRLVLEQGGAYTMKQEKTPSLKPFLAGVLMAAIVLSNAYKNDNVYNMIAPRKFIPYTQFEQLEAADFNVYTRINIETGLKKEYRMSKVKEVYHIGENPHVIYGNHQNWHSEVLFHFQKVENRKFDTTMMQKVVNRSKLPDDAVDILQATMANYDKNVEVHDYMQNKSLNERLLKCNKVALILPDLIARQYLGMLRKRGLKHSSISSSALFEDGMGFYLCGWMSNRLIRRLEGLQGSGIRNRMNDIYKAVRQIHVSGGETNQEVPAMGGNIIVIFAVLCAGYVLAILIYFTLMVISMYGRICLLVSTMWGAMKPCLVYTLRKRNKRSRKQ